MRMMQIPGALRSILAPLALCGSVLATSAGAEVIHYGPGEPYRPIYDPGDLVVNGNFNLDPLVDPSNPTTANPNVTGWTISPASEFPGTRNSNVGVGADGRGLRLGDLNLIDVSQALATAADHFYQLSFFLAVDGEPGGLLRVFVGDQLLANLDGTPYPEPGYGFFSQYIYDFQATSAQTTLLFQYQSPIGDQYLSNVSVLEIPAVPEPQTWALMLIGLALVCASGPIRRRLAMPPSSASPAAINA